MEGTLSKRLRVRGRWMLALGVLCCMELSEGCGSLGADVASGAALIRFVEVSPGSPELDFYVNGTGAAYGLGFESFTSYLPVSPGGTMLSVREAGGPHTLAISQTTLAGGHQYTAILRRGLGNLHQEILQDQSEPASAGEISLRIVNAIEGLPSLAVHLTSERAGGTAATPLTLTLAEGAESGYMRLPAGETYEVIAVAAGSTTALPLSKSMVRADSGSVRTLVLAGVAKAPNHGHVVAFVLDDADPAQ